MCQYSAGKENQICGEINVGPPNERHHVFAGNCRNSLKCNNNRCIKDQYALQGNTAACK